MTSPHDPRRPLAAIDALRPTDVARCAELEQLLFPVITRALVITRAPQAEAEIQTIGVDPAHQDRGVGRTLLRRLLAVADTADDITSAAPTHTPCAGIHHDRR